MTTLVALIPLFFGVFFFVLGVFFLFAGLRAVSMRRASRSWPSASGQVTGSEIQVKTFHFLTRMGGTSTEYRPQIHYAYNVDGIPYQGAQITYGSIDVSQPAAQAMLDKYPPGAEVAVYYNPKKPGEAVLEHADTGVAWFAILGALAALIGLCVTCFGVMLLMAKPG